jgi:hypothetical protein
MISDNVTDATHAEFPVAGTFIFTTMLDTLVFKHACITVERSEAEMKFVSIASVDLRLFRLVS